jgi:pimeloyl-ACP methyl ester carboxylesterase
MFVFATAGAQAFATTIPDGTGFVAFRGTQPGNLQDLTADARSNLVELQPGARVHAGFHAAFRSIEQPIAEWIGRTGGRRLVFTGHSLGAAMATVAAALHRDSEVVNFGSPLVGDGGFAALFAGRSLRRYVDCCDCVTGVPPRLLGYVHAGTELYIDRFGRVRDAGLPGAAIDEDRRLARRSYAMKHAWKFWRNVLARDLADHAPVNYVSAVLGRREGD